MLVSEGGWRGSFSGVPQAPTRGPGVRAGRLVLARSSTLLPTLLRGARRRYAALDLRLAPPPSGQFERRAPGLLLVPPARPGRAPPKYSSFKGKRTEQGIEWEDGNVWPSGGHKHQD